MTCPLVEFLKHGRHLVMLFFSKLDLSHPKDLIETMTPSAYKNLDFSHIDLVINATECKITRSTDLQLN